MIILTYDVGTTGVKTCLFSLGDEGSREGRRYECSIRALPTTLFESFQTEELSKIRRVGGMLFVRRRSGSWNRRPEECSRIAGISFCAQAQSLRST